jgi:endonuclease-3 related protein
VPVADPGRRLRTAYRLLLDRFGPQGWWPAAGPLEVIIGAVLTQNTSWRGVEAAIAGLRSRRLLALAPLLRLPPGRLAAIIRPAGCPTVKAKRLRNVLGWIRARGGLAALRRRPTADLRADLLAVSGVGPETADSILLYALDRPTFVVDAYTRRVLARHRLITGREGYHDIQARFHAALPRRTRVYNEYHALLVAVAKRHCRTRPDCRDCPLAGRV